MLCNNLKISFQYQDLLGNKNTHSPKLFPNQWLHLNEESSGGYVHFSYHLDDSM